MSEDLLRFNLLFTVAQRDTAFARNPAGGARMWIEIEQSTVADANRMIDLMNASAGVVFAAAVVVVTDEFGEILTNERESARSKTDNRAKGRAPTMARGRVQRPTD